MLRHKIIKYNDKQQWIKHLFAIVVLICLGLADCMSQIYAIHPQTDSIWHWDVDWNSRPPHAYCPSNGFQYFRLKYEEDLTVDTDVVIDTIATTKDDWTEDDEKEYDKKYNEFKRSELKECVNENFDLVETCDDVLSGFIKSRWINHPTSFRYTYCINNCEASDCYTIWEITELGDLVNECSYETNFSFHKEGSPNTVEIYMDLVQHVEAWIYFKIGCECEDYSEYVSSNQDVWQDITLTEDRSKPGYPFTIKEESGFPLWPVIGGAGAIGTTLYFLLGDEKSGDCSFSVVPDIVNANCGRPNGSVDITLSPSTEAYSIEWSTGSMDTSIDGLSEGTYTVTVSLPGSSCTSTAEVVIENTNSEFKVDVESSPAHCGISEGTASVSVTPEGTYSYTWSNGETSSSITNIPAGEISVTVADDQGCTLSASVEVSELPAEYIVGATAVSGNCVGEGADIILTLESPGGGMMAVRAVGPDGSYDETPSTGIIKLSDYFTVLPGEWDIMVEDMSVNGDCKDQVSVMVDDNTTITAIDDEFSTGFNTPLDGNVLSNDDGVDINLTNVINENGGTVTYQADGSFQFLPAVDFVGEASFEYTISDVCGNEAMATVVIDVLDDDCIYNISTTTNDATCDQSNGNASVTIDIPDSYNYAWSNGQQGLDLIDVAAGSYTVTVTVNGTSCSKTATVIIENVIVEFDIMLESTPANCGLSDGMAMANVTPDGNYSYMWSNGDTDETAIHVSPGTIDVTVTHESGCFRDGSIDVSELPVDYIVNVTSVPGNCIGDGADIVLILQSASGGSMEVNAIGPDGLHVISTSIGTVSLSTFLVVLPGDWHIEVKDLTVGGGCIDIVDVFVMDNTVIIAVDDNYTTDENQSLSADALINDTGLSLEMTGVTNVNGGSVTFDPDGSFVFTPGTAFVGIASFDYNVIDECGNMDNATVFIEVVDVPCNFNVIFFNDNADCGLANGGSEVLVGPIGNYTYTWSDGTVGPQLSDVMAGIYDITIVDLSYQCELVFSTEILENAPEVISNESIQDPECPEPGEISFDVMTNGLGPIILEIIHPNGFLQVSVPPGSVFLSNYIDIIAGDYTITAYDQMAGIECAETFSVSLIDLGGFDIIVEHIVPASTPTSLDGIVTITVLPPGGTLDYDIYINGSGWGIAIAETFDIFGLATGSYEIQLRDANGCWSNTLEVFVPFSSSTMDFKVVAGNVYRFVDDTEVPGNIITHTFAIGLDYHYKFLGIDHSLETTFSPIEMNISLAHYSQLLKYRFYKIKVNAGIGVSLQKLIKDHSTRPTAQVGVSYPIQDRFSAFGNSIVRKEGGGLRHTYTLGIKWHR